MALLANSDAGLGQAEPICCECRREGKNSPCLPALCIRKPNSVPIISFPCVPRHSLPQVIVLWGPSDRELSLGPAESWTRLREFHHLLFKAENRTRRALKSHPTHSISAAAQEAQRQTLKSWFLSSEAAEAGTKAPGCQWSASSYWGAAQRGPSSSSCFDLSLLQNKQLCQNLILRADPCWRQLFYLWSFLIFKEITPE